MNNDNNKYNGFFWLAFLANLAQLQSLDLNMKDATNNEILQSLQEQNSKYLEKIIEQNELIIKQNEEILRKLK